MAFKQHHAWFLVPSWGHITSANALISRMLQLNPDLVVTVVHHAMTFEKAEADIAQYEDIPQDRIRIVGVGDAEVAKLEGTKFMIVAFKQLCDGWLSTLEGLVEDGAKWPKPTALMNDQFGANLVLPDAKKIVGPSCKTFMHWTPSATSFYSFLAPGKLGGFADYEETVENYLKDDELRKGRERSEILEEVCKAKNGTDGLNGTVCKVPGRPDMYDYEREASNGPSPQGLAHMLCTMVDLAKSTDGVICASSEAIEGEALKTCSEFQKIYGVGLSVAPRGWSTGLTVKDDTIRTFLDKFEHNSVLYISFGSMFFPTTEPTHVTAFLETLEATSFPFIFGLGGRLATGTLESSLIDRINASGKGLIHNAWVDQQAILQHDAVGWFLTHGGWNSIAESLIAGVPMMVWPLAQSDQALNGALLSTGEKRLGFEFLQIRQGAAQGKAMRTGQPINGDLESVKEEFEDVFTKARGVEGERIRENVEALAVELRKERDGRADSVIKELAFV
ncbi:uncharacterized protein PAC_16813 [Phialocephala subalpina]|uniref:Uncharacterized protein n=1 Tax=Phialocephala subalpina TaxID=576137 RepID=A0A1L7XPG8_9HELO|nr:uncharacterized protein PAC_16813 [Phialocephala subalpina]